MSTILQCRQEDSKQSNNNGDFTTMLDEPIKLDPGDSINIKSCFIDTKSENSTKITVEEDLDVSLTFGYYITNHVNDLVQCFPNLVDQARNGKKYALYKNKSYQMILSII